MIASRLVTSQVWLITGSQSMYGQDILDQVADQSRQIAERLDGEQRDPGRGPLAARRHRAPTRSRGCSAKRTPAADCIGVIAWMHTFSPAKMWIRGLKTLHKPLLHLHTQFGVELPWHSIDMDFMNLNQAAHGDREFGYIQSRLSTSRKTIAGHVSDPQHPRADRFMGARGARPRRVVDAEGRAIRRQHARCRRHRGRQGRGRSALRGVDRHLRRQRPGRGRRAGAAGGRRQAGRRVRAHLPGGPRVAARRRPARVAAAWRADRARPAEVPAGWRIPRVHHELRGSRRAASAAGAGRAALDGRRLRVRRRGRLEDRDDAAHGQGDGRGPARWHLVHGGLHLRPDRGPRAHPRGAHARGLPEHRRRRPDAGDPSAGDR